MDIGKSAEIIEERKPVNSVFKYALKLFETILFDFQFFQPN